MTALDDRARSEAMAREEARRAEDLVWMAARAVIEIQYATESTVHRRLRHPKGECLSLLNALEELDVVGPPGVGAGGDLQWPVLIPLARLDETLERVADRHQQRSTAIDSAAVEPQGPLILLVKGAPAAADDADDEAGDDPDDDGPEGDDDPDDEDRLPAVVSGQQLAERPAGDVDTPGKTAAEKGQREPQLLTGVVRKGKHVVHTLRHEDSLHAKAFRGSVRYVWHTGHGVKRYAQRAADALTHGGPRGDVRIARLTGNDDRIDKAHDRVAKHRAARLSRLRQWPAALYNAALAIGWVLLAIPCVLLAIGGAAWMAFGSGGWSSWWWLLNIAAHVFAGLLVVASWLSIVLAIPATVVVAHKEGKKDPPPLWTLSKTQRAQVGAEITVNSISAALAHMKIPALTKALKEGYTIEFLVTPREQGGGTYFQARLPMGVVAAELLPSEKVELFAGNLTRHKHEVWPQRQPDADARVLDCWVADKGTMDRAAPIWPLHDQCEFDVFRDLLPLGVTMRGDPINVGMLQKHWLIGANSKQGKTKLLRLILLGIARDTTTEIRLADLKGDGDLRCLAPRCHTYIEGQAEEDAEAACVMLEDAVAEMQRRYDEKKRLGITGPITRAMSRRKGSGFHPIYVVVDECQVMYMAGKASDGSLIGGSKDESRAQRAAKRLHDQARAVNIHLIQATQRPDPQTVPVRVREGVHVRISLYVPNINAARMILADAADRGGRPYDLRPGRDAGTAVFAGEIEDIPIGQAFIIVKTYYEDDDAAQEVANQAIEAWQRTGRHLIIEGEIEPIVVDTLQDIYDVMGGEETVLTRDVLGRLRVLHEAIYGDWTEKTLAKAVREYEHLGLGIRKLHGESKLRLSEVVAAIQARG